MSSEGFDEGIARKRGGDDKRNGKADATIVSGSSTDDKDSLAKQPWYWPYATRDEAERRLAGQSDGTFLIRDCSVPGDFTLTVREAGVNKCIRIYKHPNGYSLSPTEPDSPFPSLQDLVEFYQRHSLASFNKRLKVHLGQPLPKPVSAACNQYGVFKELYDLSQDQLSAQTRLAILQQQHAQLEQRVKLHELMMPALRVVQQMYFDSMKVQEELGPTPPTLSVSGDDGAVELGEAEKTDGITVLVSASGDSDSRENRDVYRLSRDEEKSFTVNIRMLMSRHSAMSDRLHCFKSHYDTDTVKLRELEEEQQYVECDLLRMKRRQEELVRQMVEMGTQKEYLNQVLEARVATREFDRSTWLRDCTRDEALASLEGLPHGAFMIRPKDKRHLPFVLSVVVSGENGRRIIQHCYIVRPHGRGYGFNPTLAVFESIDQLVLRHRYVSLKHYFKDLDVTLTFPVGCQELLRRSVSETEKESVTVKVRGYANAAAIRDAMRENPYETVAFPEESKQSGSPVELKDPVKGDTDRSTDLSAGNVHSSSVSAVRDDVKKNESESVDLSRRNVTSSKAAAIFNVVKEHEYEYIGESEENHSTTKGNQKAVRRRKYKPAGLSRAGADHVSSAAIPNAVKEHQYESIGESEKSFSSTKDSQEGVKGHEYEPVGPCGAGVKIVSTAAISNVAKEHKYESVGESERSVSCTEGSQRAMKGSKSEPVGLFGAGVESVNTAVSHESVKDHTYETVSTGISVKPVRGAKKEDDSHRQEENVYEFIAVPVRRQTSV